ncbi:hypothetical protein M569_10667 [Genlisea aurea]|uniref:Uncharacterized protein n=1 Tax=Genlisea aurea TaxID=192259 RepID=S8CB03_9LAMI|nr:hypothetical protein M569_10667 [Genlisea aurea]
MKWDQYPCSGAGAGGLLGNSGTGLNSWCTMSQTGDCNQYGSPRFDTANGYIFLDENRNSELPETLSPPVVAAGETSGVIDVHRDRANRARSSFFGFPITSRKMGETATRTRFLPFGVEC